MKGVETNIHSTRYQPFGGVAKALFDLAPEDNEIWPFRLEAARKFNVVAGSILSLMARLQKELFLLFMCLLGLFPALYFQVHCYICQ